MGDPPQELVVPEVSTMRMSNVDGGCEVDGVPVSALLSEDRRSRYGSVPGLSDEELASPDELERAVVREEWGAVLALPVRRKASWIQPAVDEDGGVDFGAFGTVDFERGRPQFDKARYKADKLQEELRDVLIRLSVVKYRLTKAHYKVLKYLRMGVIDLDDIADVDMSCIARLYVRARRLQKEIRELKGANWSRRKKQLAEVLR